MPVQQKSNYHNEMTMPNLLEDAPAGVKRSTQRAIASEQILKRAKEEPSVIDAQERRQACEVELREAKAATLRQKTDADEKESAYHRALAEVDLGERKNANEEKKAHVEAAKSLESARLDEAKIRRKLDLLREREREAIDRATEGLIADIEERAKHLLGVCFEANEAFAEAHHAYRDLYEEMRGLGIFLPKPLERAFYVHAAGVSTRVYRTHAEEWNDAIKNQGWVK